MQSGNFPKGPLFEKSCAFTRKSETQALELVHFTEFAPPSIPMMIGLNIFEKFIKSMLTTDDCPF